MIAMITPALITDIRNQFQINWRGIHGISHWARVYENGMRLADLTNAKITVVQLFALFHDACRYSEGSDPRHGPRGAELAAHYRTTHLKAVSDADFELLFVACFLHTSANTHEDITIQTCFDSDRLDLGRVGTIPDPRYLCTKAAKSPNMIAWALDNSEAGWAPDNILGQYSMQN
jgi:uncharacterized protein